jgi:Spx/MgsR family transcriptional regulator
MSSVTLYGIANCDTVRRARQWLQSQGLQHRFHDLKKAGLPPERLAAWLADGGWEPLLNRRGTTWRGLDAATRQAVADADSARRLMLAHPSVVKRPVVEWPDGSITIGFDEAAWTRIQNQGAPANVGPARPPQD